jgi:hypothetical protein
MTIETTNIQIPAKSRTIIGALDGVWLSFLTKYIRFIGIRGSPTVPEPAPGKQRRAPAAVPGRAGLEARWFSGGVDRIKPTRAVFIYRAHARVALPYAQEGA